MAKRRKKIRPVSRSRFPIVLIAIGLSLLSLWGLHRYFYDQAMTISGAILAQYAKEPSTLSPPIHITIGDRISLPVIEAGKVGGMWAISQTSANHVYESAMPGQRGNSIIYAHNSDALFGRLEDVKRGDPVAIRTTDGALHRYVVISTAWVTPGHTELLTPTSSEILTLYTCAGLLDSLRIVVRAVPVL
ncbi:MAG: sortase [Candidatus Gottesmanbacteria bacterium]|nr:sortase [Candidatus Gottesmanbacteria bacterium]